MVRTDETPSPQSLATLSQSFAALGDDDTAIPPDTHGAVGPAHLMVALNSSVRIQTRSGASLKTVTIETFFDPVRQGNVFDPRVLYDRISGRWFLCAATGARSASSALLLGVSQTSDPTGTWNLYRFDADSANQVWLDYPAMGINARYITISANMFLNTDDSFSRTTVFVVNKQAAGGPYARFDQAGIGGTLIPAVSYDPNIETNYLLKTWNGNAEGFGYLRLYTVSDAAGLTPVAFIASPDVWAQSTGEDDSAPQAGTSRKIDAGDSRMLSVVYRKGSLWATHNVFLPAYAPTRGSVQWWQIATNGTLVQKGVIDDPSGEVFYSYPSIAANANGDVVIGGTRFSRTTYPSAFYAFRSGVDPRSTTTTPTIFKEGQAPYYKTSSGGSNRWGDYSATAVDPVNDLDFWTIQEYSARPVSGMDRWGTWWAQVVPPATSAGGCTPNSTTACLLSKRFKATVRYRGAFDNNPADSNALVKTVTGFSNANYETTFFYFNSPDNIEILLKMLDQGNTNSSGQPTIAVLFGSATPLRVELTITDTKTGAVRQYTSAFAGQAGTTDFTAFVK